MSVFKGWLFPLAVIAGLVLAFMYVFRDQLPKLSTWTSGGRTTGTLTSDVPQ